jgi:phenylacetyl-CoA:acceptor oxidoreductase subunit 1
MRWGMVIDTRRCVGCQTCTIACKQEHGLPAGTFWRFVADCEVGEYPAVRRLFLPMQCMHCAQAPCVPVCPTGASRQRPDGYFDAPTPAEAAQARPERRGVMTKCTFCKERIDGGLDRGLTPGLDPDATPMCAVACIAGAIVFGDLDDPASPASRLLAEGQAVPLMPECGTAPAVYYIVE